MTWKATSGLTEDKPLTSWKAPAHAPAPTQQPPHKEGPPPSSEGTSSVFACTLLVAGTAVGAGMLALPTVTSPAGFGASAVALCAGCAYSIVTGLLVAEVTINTLQQQQRADGDLESASEHAGGSSSTSRVSIGSTSSASSIADAANSHANPVVFARGSSGSSGSSSSSSSGSSAASVSLTSIAQPLLGSKALPLVILPYFFLHYSLLVAYIAKAGELVGSWLHLPLFEGVALFTAVFGGGCYFLSAKRLDQINGSLVVVLIASFLGLLGIAARDLDPSRLGFAAAHWSALPPALPVIALAFVFQNIVPVVVQRLDCDPKKIRTSIFAGMGISLLMFLLWDGAILGSASSTAALDPLASLRAVTAYAGPLIEVFSFVAVATSFVGFVLSLTDFIGDTAASSRKQQRLAAASAGAAPGSGISSDGTVVLGRPLLYFLALAPPMVLALLYPTIFFLALDYAGSYGVMSLFGLLPAVLAWQQRYVAGGSGGRGDGAVGAGGLVVDEKAEPLLPRSGPGSGSELVMVPGGRAALLLVSGVALAIIANQAVIHVGELVVALS